MTLVTRKKVLFLITKSNWGGAQRYVYDLATHLDPNQFEVMVALGGNGTLVEMLSHAGIRTINIKTLSRDISIKKEFAFARELWNILRTEKPDVFHVNSSKAGGVGTLLGRLHLVPRVIFTAHGWAFNEDRPWWQKPIIKFLHWLTVMFSHRTIAVSSAIASEMNWLGARGKMKIINPGRTIGVVYGKTEARTMLADFCPQLKNVANDRWVITIAELHQIKRLNVLIEAMKEISPSVKCVIIGEGQERQRLEMKIAENDLQTRVFLTGAITEAARFLKAADLFVLPSKSESYGYVVHEAGLSGIPVVATSVGGIRDIISSSNEGLLVPPDDIDRLSEAITNSLQNKEASIERARLLKEKLQNRSATAMTEATAALYLLPLK